FSKLISTQYRNLKFHRFPRDPETLQKWKNACNITDEVNCINFYVCENHFNKSDYTNHLQERLKYQTVPKPANTSQFILPVDEALLRPSCSYTDNST
ncbi:unnamed protein product, partial [Tenebrio molitor]